MVAVATASQQGSELTTMGGRIQWARRRKEMTQEQVADLVGKARATVVQYEKGRIFPPVKEVENLATILGVSPEFLAFGRHGVEGMNNAAEEIVALPEVTEGADGKLYTSGAFAVPRKLFAEKDVDPQKARMFFLKHDEAEFNFATGDRLILDQSIKAVDLDHDLFLIQSSNGPHVVRREPNFIGGPKGSAVLTTGRGVSQTVKTKELEVLGAIIGKFSLA